MVKIKNMERKFPYFIIMGKKKKKHYEVNIQRGRRSKLQGLIDMKFEVYDDSSFNRIHH